MKQSILFFTPYFQERIWGGQKLKEVFHYDTPYEKTAECWAISGHQNGESIINNGALKGKSLRTLWEDERSYFGNITGDSFPLLIKILDAHDDLSVQVHPGDEYANRKENGERGKTECWYIIDCDEGAELVIGHNATSKADFNKYIENGEWDKVLRRVPIAPGDFFYIPSGSVHAICKGVLILETQQSSDVTYRLYDYDRTDDSGQKRELHLERALDVINYPHEDVVMPKRLENREGLTETRLVSNEFFTVCEWVVTGKCMENQNHSFLLASVLRGKGTITVAGEQYDLEKGQHFMLPSHVTDFSLDGDCQLIISHM